MKQKSVSALLLKQN